jgi:translation initiation factor 2A
MPATSNLFDKILNPKFEFGKHHRNTIRWSNSRFVLLGGFGNLSGEIEVWDTFQLKKVGSCKVDYLLILSI